MVLKLELTFCVKPRLIPSFFASINVYPPLFVLAIYFGPDMIFTVPYPPDTGTCSSAKHRKAIGPLSTPPSLRVEQRPHIRVSWEALIRHRNQLHYICIARLLTHLGLTRQVSAVSCLVLWLEHHKSGKEGC